MGSPAAWSADLSAASACSASASPCSLGLTREPSPSVPRMPSPSASAAKHRLLTSHCRPCTDSIHLSASSCILSSKTLQHFLVACMCAHPCLHTRRMFLPCQCRRRVNFPGNCRLHAHVVLHRQMTEHLTGSRILFSRSSSAIFILSRSHGFCSQMAPAKTCISCKREQ